jgi:hypothetical protein
MLKGLNKTAMILSLGLMGLFAILDLAITEFSSLTLVTLS